MFTCCYTKIIIKPINYESPLINGDEVFQETLRLLKMIRMNVLLLLSKNKDAINEVYILQLKQNINIGNDKIYKIDFQCMIII